jgi:Tfp pilus assembly protein PilZ
MERRAEKRFPRRIEVRFWRKGEEQSHSAFTTNVSRTGVFLGTGQTLFPGERVRLELVDPEHGFIAEGRVVRVHRVSLALRHVEQPGIGVRFLLPDELISELLPAVARAAPRAAPEVPPPQYPTAPEPPEVDDGRPDPVTGRAVVAVEFIDRSAFLSVYHRDIAQGGLFVSTANPAELHAVVTIELRPPIPGVGAFRFEARVVHRFEPDAAVGDGRNLLAGMGVQFLEPDRVRAALAPILAQLRA